MGRIQNHEELACTHKRYLVLDYDRTAEVKAFNPQKLRFA